MNDARVNEDPTSKLIRDLRTEIELLRSQYGSAKGQGALAELSELKEKLNTTQRLMEESNRYAATPRRAALTCPGRGRRSC